ncbi:MAG: sulfotransferase family protein [Egibacteraceae bacterium]
MNLQVIGAGFGRTGTASMKAALEELGFGPCYHMLELVKHPEHAPRWLAATRGEPVDWNGVFQDYRSTADWPGCTFYKELLEACPGAKVVLTVRDPDKWYDSALNTIYAMGQTRQQPRLLRLGNLVAPSGWRAAARVIDELVWNRTFNGAFEDRRHAIEIFERHNEEVKRHVPADQLLVYQPGDGWGPLCEFLGVEVPQGTPFPHLNDAETFRSRIQANSSRARAASVAAMLLVGLGTAGMWAAACRWRAARDGHTQEQPAARASATARQP